MGLIIGAAVVVIGAVIVKYGIGVIIAGVSTMAVYLGLKKKDS